MRANCVISVMSLSAILLCTAWAGAQGVSPPDQQVTYYLREVPEQAQSPVVFDIVLTLSAQAVSGKSVGWHIDRIAYHQRTGSAVLTWTEEMPVVNSADGLWWIQHATAAAPEVREFVKPPLLVGTALAERPENPALNYSFVGADYTGTPSLPFANTGALTFTFVVDGESTPTEEGENEPTEINGGPEPGST